VADSKLFIELCTKQHQVLLQCASIKLLSADIPRMNGFVEVIVLPLAGLLKTGPSSRPGGMLSRFLVAMPPPARRSMAF
jgi:hypothetical protein